jgi:hypothetical protein
VAARLASARSTRADLLAARAAVLAPGSAWVRAGRLGRAGVREAVRVGRRLGQEARSGRERGR